MKTLARLSLAVLILALPLATEANSLTVGANSNGGFFFGFSTGNGAGFGGGVVCGGGDYLCALASHFIDVINYVLVPLIFAIAFLMFLYGVAKAYIFSHGDEGAVKEGHQAILWGVLGFVVMISVWGLVNVVSNTFGLSGGYAPLYPTSY